MSCSHAPGVALLGACLLSGALLALPPARPPTAAVEVRPLTLDDGIEERSLALPVPSVQQRLAKYIADEWRLGVDYALTVVQTAYAAAERYRLDPLLLLAVAGVESSFRHLGNPDGGRDPARAFGIMQVVGKYHKDKFSGGVVRETDVTENIDIGARVVQEYLGLENGDERRALLRYNGTLNAEESAYDDTVLRLKQRLARGLARTRHKDHAMQLTSLQ